MPEQLTFELPVRTSTARGDFFVSEANALAVARLEDTGGWPDGKLVLAGPEGSGKSHLGQVWAEAEDAYFLTSIPAQTSLPETAMVIEIPEALSAAEEETLFHVHNHMVAHRLPLLMLARTPPARWRLALPDLKSRMEATDIVRIEPPDDALLAAVIVKLFSDRQLDIAPAVISWLVARIDRSFAEAQRVVALLDQAALAEGRAVTRALAQRVLTENDP
ncbi:MAG: chromosomal replication initiator DnaA [Silicimonas sp.]|jgi:chromosomal replication initiation ATPase DnaA|nr:chromosomal replication initiator DnaA [Silicimonas sp.]